MEGVQLLPTSPRRLWNLEVVLISLTRGRFVVVHPFSTLSLHCKVVLPWDAEVENAVKLGFFCLKSDSIN